jgi:hypothetical protein
MYYCTIGFASFLPIIRSNIIYFGLSVVDIMILKFLFYEAFHSQLL